MNITYPPASICSALFSRRLLAAGLAVLTVACAADKSEYLRRGDAAFSAGKYREATVEYRNAIAQDAQFGQARLRLADAYVELGNPREAAGEYIRAADLLPDDTEAQIKAAKALIFLGRYEDAKTSAERLLKRNPDSVDALIVLGNAYAGLKDLDGAIAEVEEATRISPDRADALLSLGALQIAKGDALQAEAAFKQALTKHPQSIEVHGALANLYWATGRLQDAEELLKKALTIDAKNLTVLRGLAAMYLATNRMAEAEAHLKTVASISSAPIHKLILADYYEGIRRFSDARQYIDEAAKAENVPPAEINIRLARIATAEGDRPAAYKHLDELLAVQNNHAGALAMKAQLLMADGRLDDALAAAQASVQADAQLVSGQYVLGTVLLERQQINDARNAFTEVLRLNPRAAAARIQLAQLEFLHGRVDNALEHARTAVALAPRNPDGHLALIRGLLAQQKIPEAATRLEAMGKAFPDSPVVEAYKGAMYLVTNDARAARASFERALVLDPQSVDAVSGLVTLDLRAKDTAAATARVETALAKNRSNPLLLLRAAQTYAAVGREADVERLLIECINTAPAELRAYEMLGALYIRQRRIKDAQAKFEEFVRRQPNNVTAHTMVGMLLEAQGQTAEARQRYEQVLSIDKNAAVAANNLAYLLAQAGEQPEIAVQLAHTAKSQLPTMPQVDDTLGWAYYKQGAYQLALDPLKQSVSAAPNRPVPHFHLGLVYAKLGDTANAKASLETALKLKPDFAGAEEARRVLASIASTQAGAKPQGRN
jgi:putative PEP-CTERM system TPR-repeat lipoprotein